MAAKDADMTVAQAMDFRRMAIQKGATRGKIQKGGTILARALDEISHIGECPVLQPPPGGRVHLLRTKTILDRDWQEAINAGGPQTPANYNVRKVGNLYLPTGQGEVEREYILLHNNRAGFDAALAWGKQNRFNQTVPREVFAISEHNPTLHRGLGFNPMWLAATTACQFGGYRQACYVWWGGTERGASLDWVECFDSTNVWFAFSRDLVLGPLGP